MHLLTSRLFGMFVPGISLSAKGTSSQDLREYERGLVVDGMGVVEIKIGLYLHLP